MIAPLLPDSESHRDAPQFGGGGDPVVQAVARATAAGLPLAESLEAYSEEAFFRGANSSFRKLGRALRNGVPLDEAVEQLRPALSPYVAGLVRAAAGSGRLTLVLEQHLIADRRTRDIRFRYWLAAAYPIVLLIVSLLIVFGILVWFVPSMQEVFIDFGVPLPAPTRFTIAASQILLQLLAWWPNVLIVLAVIVIGIKSLRFLPGRAKRVRLYQWLPLFGTVNRSVALSEFCGLLSLLVECHVPLPQALRLTAGAIRDPNLAEGSLKLAELCEKGQPADQEMAYLSHFPQSLASTFRWTGRPEALASGLRAAAELYAAQARIYTWVAGSFVQPFVLATVLIIAGGMAITLFLPLFTLLQSLT